VQRHAGWMAAAALCLAGSAAAETPEPPPGRGAQPPKAFVTVGLSRQFTKHAFDTAVSMAIYAEDTTIQQTYRVGPGTRFDVGGGARIAGRFMLGGALSRRTADVSVHVSGSVPHPFFFNQLRPVSGDDVVQAREIDIHIQALVLLVDAPGWLVAFGGGPTVVRLSQDVATGLELDDTYPFTSVGITSVTTTRVTGLALGGHAALVVSRRIGNHLALGMDVLWSQTRVKLKPPAGNTIPVRTGGVQAGAALRLLF